ncbi:MAG: hypothetical protein J0M17_09770 [Planctomycetes bacterium]|jgi:hypothetical protein|nr:hypothetical protein [Planctomycetota bacterium]
MSFAMRARPWRRDFRCSLWHVERMGLLCLLIAVLCLLFPRMSVAVWGLLLFKVWWRNNH